MAVAGISVPIDALKVSSLGGGGGGGGSSSCAILAARTGCSRPRGVVLAPVAMVRPLVGVY